MCVLQVKVCGTWWPLGLCLLDPEEVGHDVILGFIDFVCEDS